MRILRIEDEDTSCNCTLEGQKDTKERRAPRKKVEKVKKKKIFSKYKKKRKLPPHYHPPFPNKEKQDHQEILL